MAYQKTHRARMGKQLRGKPGNLHDLQKILWYALKKAQAVLDEAGDDNDLTLKACHAVSQVAGQYAKLLEIGYLEQRVQALEERQGIELPWTAADEVDAA